MIALPAVAAAISAACLVMVGRDALRRPSPDKVAWIIAFALFTLAAGAEFAGSLIGWSPLLVRAYYLAGAVLVVGFLGLGELYLLVPNKIGRVGPGIGLFMFAVAAALVVDAPIDGARLATEGWHAMERGPALIAVTVAINTIGTVVVVGGAAYSAWQFWRRGIFQHRMIGCLLIALGTLTVASGGTLTRLGRPEYLYIAMSIGITLIFAGYLEARRRDAPVVQPRRGQEPSRPVLAAPAPVVANGVNGHSVPAADPSIAFLTTLLAGDSAGAIAERCHLWSIDEITAERFDRGQARRVWALRLRLPVAAQERLDQLPAATQVQVADLYHEVLAPGSAEWAAIRGAGSTIPLS